jgi:hypothetical protein
MSDHLDRYFDAWKESDGSARSVQLNKCVTSDFELVHPVRLRRVLLFHGQLAQHDRSQAVP